MSHQMMNDRMAIGFSEPPIIVEVERAFDHFNEHLFDGSLIKPLFKVNLKKKARIRFHGSGPDAGSFEMVVGYGIAMGSLEDLLEDLLHEMVHVKNWLEKVIDCTSNQYHNQFFKEAALNAGLFVIRHKTRGWGVTSLRYRHERRGLALPPDDRRESRIAAVESLDFNQALLEDTQNQIREDMSNINQKQFQYKYVCKCLPPHNSVRCGRRPDGPRPLSAYCMKCKSVFELDEG